MKIFITLLLFFTLHLQAESKSFFDINLLSDDLPQWLQKYKAGEFITKDRDTLYFMGISSPKKSTQKKEAYQEARNSGLSQISNYINVSVSTSMNLDTNVANGEYNEKSDTNINTISFVDLDGVVPFKEYLADEDEGVVAYALFKMNERELQKKKELYTKKAQEYTNLMQDVRDAIDQQDLDKANKMLNKLKSFKQSKVDQRFIALQKELNSYFKVDITSNIKNEKKFMLDEYVKVSFRPSKSVYIYVLLEYGKSKKIKMIFPNERDNQNFIREKQSRSLKVKTKRKHIADSANKILLYAAYSPLPFNEYVNAKYELSSDENARWKYMLQDREENSIVYKKSLEYFVENKQEELSKICLIKEGEGLLAKKILNESKSLLKKSFKVKRSCKKVDFVVALYYEESSEYMESLEHTIRKIEYAFSVFDENEEEIYASDEISEEFYFEASKNQVFKEMKTELKLLLKDMTSTIKEFK